MIEAAGERDERARQMMLYGAWHIAALAGSAFGGKLPPLSRLLIPQPRAITADERVVRQAEHKKLIEEMGG